MVVNCECGPRDVISITTALTLRTEETARMADNDSTIKRFYDKVIPEPNSGCWLWIGCNSKRHGYGSFWMGGKVIASHIAAYRLFKGLVPEGLELDHLCRMPFCVNPDHLEAVTHTVNVL